MVISSARPEDSGRYECVAESTSGHRASLAAQLLVARDTRITETSKYLFIHLLHFIHISYDRSPQKKNVKIFFFFHLEKSNPPRHRFLIESTSKKKKGNSRNFFFLSFSSMTAKEIKSPRTLLQSTKFSPKKENLDRSVFTLPVTTYRSVGD